MQSRYPKVWIEKFWKKVKKTDDPNECWIWTGYKHRGYGYIRTSRSNLRCHRVVYEITFGEIPEGLIICHKCDNPACVNPNHLFLGTTKDNIDDKVKKGRQSKRESAPHKLTEKQVKEIRERYIPGVITQTQLGKEFGVSQRAIHKIINRKTWK